MRLVLGPFGDPALEHFLLLGRELLVRRRRRHQLFGIVGTDARDQLAFLRLARHDGAAFDRRLAPIEPQVGLAGGAIRPVAGKAVFGQDRPNVAVVADRLVAAGRGSEH